MHGGASGLGVDSFHVCFVVLAYAGGTVCDNISVKLNSPKAKLSKLTDWSGCPPCALRTISSRSLAFAWRAACTDAIGLS